MKANKACPCCKTMNAQSANYCLHCGRPLSGMADAAKKGKWEGDKIAPCRAKPARGFRGKHYEVRAEVVLADEKTGDRQEIYKVDFSNATKIESGFDGSMFYLKWGMK